MELQKPKFEVLSKDKDKIVLTEEWSSVIQGVINRKLAEFTIERNTEFFARVFECLAEDELLNCQRLIESNLKQRFNHD